MYSRGILCITAALFFGGCAATDAQLFDGMGTYRRPAGSRSELAQRYFDQGLILTYGFNHDEAARSFNEATRLDPDYAMAWWGLALALGPNYVALRTRQPRYGGSRERETCLRCCAARACS